MKRFFKRIKRWLTPKAPVKPNPVPVGTKPAVEHDEPEDNLSPAKPSLGALWCPFAQIEGKQMKTNGFYRKGYPEGAVIHFTAGRCESEADAVGSLNWGIDEGFCFFVIGPTGRIYQRFPLNRWGSHAGKSFWPGLGDSVSKYLVGIEVACAGKVSNTGVSWFGVTYAKERLRSVAGPNWGETGVYVKYTPQQEVALRKLLNWLKANNPAVFNFDYVVGHHEVSPGRKNDPGGSLSVPMADLRSELKRGVTKTLP